MSKRIRIASPQYSGDRAERCQECHHAMEQALEILVLHASALGWTDDEVAFALLHNAGHRMMKLMADRQMRDHPVIA